MPTLLLLLLLFCSCRCYKSETTPQVCPRDIHKVHSIINDYGQLIMMGVESDAGANVTCHIPFIKDPQPLLPAWTISLGASHHWGMTMQMIYYMTNIQYPQTANIGIITELIVQPDGSYEIQVSDSLQTYKCPSNHASSKRITMIESRFLNQYVDWVESLVHKCHDESMAPMSPPTVMLDVTLLWYDMCRGATKFCFSGVTETNSEALKHAHLVAMLDKLININTISLLVGSMDMQVLQERYVRNTTLFRHPNIDYVQVTEKFDSKKYPRYLHHRPNAIMMGRVMACIFKVLVHDDFESFSCRANVDSPGCSSIDALNHGYYEKMNLEGKPYRGPMLQVCEVTPDCWFRNASVLLSTPIRMNVSDPYHEIYSPRKMDSISLTHFQPSSILGIVLSALIVGCFIWNEKREASGLSMPGLGVVRFMASLHIVAGHLERYGRAVMVPISFAEFGFTWVPFFMMISGFVLSWSSLTKNKAIEPWSSFVRKRLQGIYPVYLAGIMACTAMKKTPGITDLLLMQAWYPGWTESSLMSHTWFLSAILPLWATHGIMHRHLSSKTECQLLQWILIATLIPCLLFNMFHITGHNTGEYDSMNDVFIIMLKFHPLSYYSTYSCGIAGACLAWKWDNSQDAAVRKKDIELGKMKKQDEAENQSDTDTDNLLPQESTAKSTLEFLHFVRQYASSIGMVCLWMCFAAARWAEYSRYKLGFRLGMLIPCHVLLTIGLAIGSTKDPLNYIFSSPWLRWCGSISYSQYVFQFIIFHLWDSQVDHYFWIWCVACATVVHLTVDRPCKKKAYIRGGLGILAIGLLVHQLYAMTMQIKYIDRPLYLYADSDGPGHRWINPSVLMHEGSLKVIARRLQIFRHGVSTVWKSEVGIGALDHFVFQHTEQSWYEMEMIQLSGNGESTVPCQQNRTTKIGFEDPRLLIDHSVLYATSVHYTQHEEECVASQTLTRLSDKKSVHMLPEDPSVSSKNWMYMTSHKRSSLYMVNVNTQHVVKVHTDSGKWSTLSVGNQPFFTSDMHGGSNMVSTLSVVDSHPIYLTVVHSKRSYKTFLIEIERELPFRIRRRSRVVPLYVQTCSSNHSSCGGAFGSGLMVLPNRSGIVISYGSSDYQSRVFIQDEFQWRRLFTG